MKLFTGVGWKLLEGARRDGIRGRCAGGSHWRVAGDCLPRKQQAGGADEIRGDVVTMGAKEFLKFSHHGVLFQNGMTLARIETICPASAKP